jgi:hypothetical protein
MDDVPSLIGLAAALLAVPACAADIRPPAEVDATPDDDAGPSGPVQTVRNPDGSYTTRLDATAADAWRRVDLETGTEAATGWELGGQRFHLMLNGGVSGDAGVEIAPAAGGFGDVTAAPTTGWITDAADGDDPNLDPDYAFEQGDGWYAYDVQTHVLTPRPIVWVVRTSEDQMIKMMIEAYYDDAGTAAHFRLRWAPLGGGS